jgi:hypothetical protein
MNTPYSKRFVPISKMHKYLVFILFPLVSFAEEITFQCKYKSSNDNQPTEMNESIIYDTSKESLSVGRYKEPLQCVKDNWVMNCKGRFENENENIQDLITIGRKDINYRQTITIKNKDNLVEKINNFSGKCRIVESN